MAKQPPIIRLLSPVDLSHLQAFRFWLRHAAPAWDLSLPGESVVETGANYPAMPLYLHGTLVGTICSPMQALEKIGDSKLLQQYETLITEDLDSAEHDT